MLGLTRRLSAKRTFLNNVMQQVERYGDAHAKVTPGKQVHSNGVAHLVRCASSSTIARPCEALWVAKYAIFPADVCGCL